MLYLDCMYETLKRLFYVCLSVLDLTAHGAL